MGKILFFIFDNFSDFEITFVAHLLKVDSGKEILMVSYKDEIIKSASGIMYKPNKLVKDILLENTIGLIIPGGWFGECRAELIELIQGLNKEKKLVAGICGAGTYLLAASKVLENVSYTTPITSWTEKHIEVFGEMNPFPRKNFVDSRVVVSDNIITAKGIAFIDFSVEICNWFNLFKSKEEINDFLNLINNME